MNQDYASILQHAEQELADLLADKNQLVELRSKYAAQYETAEQEWKAKRTAKNMEEMQKAKSFRDTVLASLKDQEHEIAKAQAYVVNLREEQQRQQLLTEISEDASRLAEVQQEHTQCLLKLYESMWQQLSEMGQLRFEWQAKHAEAWEKVRNLGANTHEGVQIAQKAGADLPALRLAAPIHGSQLLGHQKPYMLPMPERPELHFLAEALIISGLPVSRQFVKPQKVGEPE